MNSGNGLQRSGNGRAFASLSLFLAVCVVTVTGILAFLRPFSITVISLHAIFGLCFALAAVWHIKNNFPNLRKYLRTKLAMVCAMSAVSLAVAIFLQAPPVQAFMRLSANTGPSRGELVDQKDDLHFHYAISDDYLIELDIRRGSTYPVKPRMAIWLENQSAYHIHTLYVSDADDLADRLPYWNEKRRKWKKARDDSEAKKASGVDGISTATLNNSFDPADYVLADDQRYTVMLEINAGQNSVESASLIYSVEIDNSDPAHFQVLSRLGTPQKNPEPQFPDKNAWQIGYDVSGLGTILTILDSTLVTIHRNKGKQQ